MQLHYLIYIPTICVSLVLAIIVYINNRRKSANLTFSAFILAAIFWTICNFLADIAKQADSALFWSRMAIIGPAFMPALFLHFSFMFPKLRKKLSKTILILFYFPILPFFILTPTNWNVSKVVLQEWGADVTSGFLYYPLFIYFLVYVGFALFNLIKSYKVSDKIEKIQIRLIFLGMSLGIAWGVFANLILLLLGTSRLSAFGPLSAIILVIFTTYAITKHQLFNIRVILTETLVAAIGLILLIQATLAKTLWDIIFRAGIFLLFSYFGWQLVKSVLQEIKRRQEVETLNVQLAKSLEEIKERDKKLEELYKIRHQFLDIASHQLRTPVSVIIGSLDMFKEGTVFTMPKEKQQMFIEGLYQKGRKLSSIIDDILTASEMEQGKLKLILRPVQVEEVIEKAMRDLEIAAKERNLKFEFKKPKKPLPQIESSEMHLREAISNLVDNAIKYTKEGGVIVSAYIKNENLMIEVQDTGMGIPKAEQPKLFGQFIRASNAKEMYTDGTGLGLWIAKTIVESHPDGKIWFESEEGKGTTFYIKLKIK